MTCEYFDHTSDKGIKKGGARQIYSLTNHVKLFSDFKRCRQVVDDPKLILGSSCHRSSIMLSLFSVNPGKILRFTMLPLLIFFCTWPITATSTPIIEDQVPAYRQLPSLREQASLQDSWTKERISNIPSILQKYEVDAWLMSQREYAEDTVFWSLKSAKQFSARRRTVQLYFANATEFAYTWIDNTPTVWSELLAVLESMDPATIAVNFDRDIAFSGGLHVGEYDNIVEQLGSGWSERLVSEPMLAVEFIATMPEAQLSWYEKLQETAWAMISEAFSEAVIIPGRTTAEDVEWWLREKTQQQNYSTWFMSDVEIVVPNSEPGFSNPFPDETINFGDLLHVDFGVTALGMNTDTQHLAYVLYPGETERDIPKGLLEGLKKANRLQDIVKKNMKVGNTGNQILKVCLEQMRKEGIEGKIYSHPIGD